MTDIIILALPPDADRAGLILDGLVETKVAGPWGVELVIETPGPTPEWRKARQKALKARCVIFCWSSATSAPESQPFADLARRVLAQEDALSVELETGARPAELAACTTYPLHGWRADPRPWQRFIFGNRFVTQIAAAAQQKVMGRDPPPPSAYAAMVRAQAWVTIVGLAAIMGLATAFLDIYRDPWFAKLMSPRAAAAFEAARAGPSPCEALRAFGNEHTGSAWSEMASELLATCATREVTVTRTTVQRLAVFGMTATEAGSDAVEKCATYASNSGAKVTGVQVEGFIAGERATAVCSLAQPTVEQVETFGGTAPAGSTAGLRP